MGYVITGLVCLIVGFGGGVFLIWRYDLTTDYLIKKFHEADGKFDSFVEKLAAKIKGLF